MNPTAALRLSKLPEDGLRFFHGLSNWVEDTKASKPKLVRWQQGKKALSKLYCIKSKRGEQPTTTNNLPCNTLYVPYFTSGILVFRHLRNAFCHNDLEYDPKTKQYRIELTNKVIIAGQFSLEAIEEFVRAFLPATKQ